jgi:CDP-glycerol glycerophosphotransferase
MKILKQFIYFVIGEFYNLIIKPDNNKWLFSSSFNNEYNYNSKYLFEYVLKKHPSVNCKFVINDDGKREKLIKEYGDYFIETKTIKGIKEALKSGVWFTSSGLPLYLLFSGKRRIIFNLWHGTPLKKIVLKDNKTSSFKKFFIKLIHSRNYSFISTSSSKLIELYQQSFGVNKDKIKVLGQPRNDMMNEQRDRNEWLKSKYPNLPSFKKTILYAPTFREFGETRLFPFEDFNSNEFDEFLEKENTVLFLRFHQSEATAIKVNSSSRIQYINNDIVSEINEVLNIFDLLITDYSSIYFDYLLTLKPVLFLPYDYELYVSQRGLNFEYNDITPGPKPDSLGQFIDEISKLLNNPDYYTENRIAVNNYFNEIKSNNSDKILDFIFEEINKK